jgi:hypothetical protein
MVDGLLGSGTLTQAPFEVSAIVRKGTLDVGGDLGVRASLKISAIASAELGATELDSILAQNASRATARAQVLMDTGSTTRRHGRWRAPRVGDRHQHPARLRPRSRDSAILWSTGMLGGRNEWRHRADASLDNLNVTAGGGVQALAHTRAGPERHAQRRRRGQRLRQRCLRRWRPTMWAAAPRPGSMRARWPRQAT